MWHHCQVSFGKFYIIKIMLNIFLCYSSLLLLGLTTSHVSPTHLHGYEKAHANVPFHIHVMYIIYINSVSLSVRPSVEVLKPISLLIKLSPRTWGPKNYSGPRVFTSYFYFYVRFRAATTGGPYFLVLLLRPFPRSNYRRSLLLSFTFPSVSAQQLPEVLTS